MAAIENRACTHAEELIRLLSNPVAWYGERDTAAFRGQGDATWSLVPTAMRSAEAFDTLLPRTRGDNPKRDHVRDEARVLGNFVRVADQAGLAVPGGAPLWSGIMDLYVATPTLVMGPGLATKIPYDEFPPAELDVALAFARHQGVPTRLLDWSRRPLVAAYFAVRQTMEEIVRALPTKLSKELVIWCCDLDRIAHDSEAHSWRSKVRKVTVPFADNARLRAQGGLFSLVTGKEPWALDVLVENHDGLPPTNDLPYLNKLTLPWPEVPDLFERLRFLGVSGETIYPDYPGVLLAMEDEALLSKVTRRASP